MIETTEPFRPTIRTQADLERAWVHVLRPRRETLFTRHSVWLMLIEADDRALTRIVEIEGCSGLPTDDQLAGFAGLTGSLVREVAPGGRWAFLLTRPGGAGVTGRDRTWAAGLLRACRGAGVPTDVVHLATGDAVVPLPYDELAGVA